MTPPNFTTVTDAGPDSQWITMVHGISQDMRVFSAQIDAFRADYRLLLIDLPGHGGSAARPGPYGMTEFAAAIDAAMGAAGIEGAHYWGTHLGAASGLLLACRKPDLFHSLVLEGPVYPGRAMPSVSAMLARIAQAARIEGLDAARAVVGGRRLVRGHAPAAHRMPRRRTPRHHRRISRRSLAGCRTDGADPAG